MSIYDLVVMNLVSAEVHRKNMGEDTHPGFQPSEKETQQQILINQQIIMLMLMEKNYGEDIAVRVHEKLDDVKFNETYERWEI